MNRDVALRVVGWTCLIGLATTAGLFGTVLAFGVPRHPWTSRWLAAMAFIFLFVPVFVMEWDLDTGALAEKHKRPWRDQLLWGLSGTMAAFFYLIRKDRRVGQTD